MREVVIAFSGRITSGKSSLSVALSQVLVMPRVSFGDYVREAATYLGLDASDREILQDLGAFLAKRPVPFCSQVLAQAGDKQSDSIIVDGVRHESILDELIALVAPRQVVLVYIRTNDESVKRRSYQERGVADIRRVEDHSTESQVASQLPLRANIIIDNDDESSLEATLQNLLEQLRGHKTI